MYVFLIFLQFLIFSKNCKNIFFDQKFVHFGINSSIYCSRIIVAHVNVFSKVHPACHNIAKCIKPGSNSKTTDKHVASAQKLYVGA